MDVPDCDQQREYHMPRNPSKGLRHSPDGDQVNDVVVYQQPNDDCQHRCHLSSSFKNCQAQLEMIMVSHDSYISLIEELKNDLDSLSYEMKSVHDELGRQNVMDHDSYSTNYLPDHKDNLQMEMAYEPMKKCSPRPHNRNRGNRNRHLPIEQAQDDSGKAFDNAESISIKSEDMVMCACQYANSVIPIPENLQAIEESSNKLECLDYLPSDNLQKTQMQQLDYAVGGDGINHRKSYLQPAQNDDNLKAQINEMSDTICEQEKQINHMSAMLRQLDSKHEDKMLSLKENKDKELDELRQKLKESNAKAERLMNELSGLQKGENFFKDESQKLNKELGEVKQKNLVLLTQHNQLKTLLQTQEQHRMDLVKKYQVLDENYECQSKKLRAMQAQFGLLQERLSDMERGHDAHVKEYQRIQGELMAFREREAIVLGKYTALQEQFRKANTEIDQAHQVIKQQQNLMEQNEQIHRNNVKALQQGTDHIRAEFHNICEEYKKLQVQYTQQMDVDKHNERVLDSFRKWKEAQTKADAATRQTFRQYEGNIRQLLEEKQQFLDEYRRLQRDFHLVQNELTRIRRAAASKRGPGMVLDPDTETIQRIDMLRNLTSSISHHAARLYGDTAVNGAEQNNFNLPNN